MILGQAIALFHGSPVLPLLLRLVDGGSPDFLSPDDVLEVESTAVLHAPLSDFLSGECSRLSYCQYHGTSCASGRRNLHHHHQST